MSLLHFLSGNHPQQIQRFGRDVSIDDRATVAEVFGPLNVEFGPFTVDVAAAVHNTKCERFYDETSDGLGQSWEGETVWCNPPYSAIAPWLSKAWHETHRNGCRRVVLLLPANRTEQGWWQDLVEPFRDCSGSRMSTRFVRGRLRFLKPGQTVIRSGERPPFGCVVVVIDQGDSVVHLCPEPSTLFEVRV